MIRFAAAPLLALLLLPLSAPLADGPASGFDEGMRAADRGDFATALRVWAPLAQQGDAEAQFNIGILYEYGLGVVQDYAEAAECYRMAAVQGNLSAQFSLAVMYSKGRGVAQDHAEAARLYREAAERGYAPAQNNLGIKLSSGEGIAPDRVEAYKWFAIATARGNKASARGRDIVARRMTAEEIGEAQRRARAWIAEFEAKTPR